VQTSNPDHYSLTRAAANDYRGFYADELPARRAFQFPPFAELAVLTYSDVDEERAVTVSRDAADELASALVREKLDGVRIMGPSPAFIHKLRGEYRWQLTLRGAALERIHAVAPRGRGWSYDIDPLG
jgi:primosomal protein N' (replication factor Y)